MQASEIMKELYWLISFKRFEPLSTGMVVLIIIIVGIGQKLYGFRKFYTLKINLTIGFIQKICWNALVRL